MNERIKELEKQSYTEFPHEHGGTYRAFNKQKFAELIVLECASISDEAEPYQSSDLIKKHFGVNK